MAASLHSASRSYFHGKDDDAVARQFVGSILDDNDELSHYDAYHFPTRSRSDAVISPVSSPPRSPPSILESLRTFNGTNTNACPVWLQSTNNLTIIDDSPVSVSPRLALDYQSATEEDSGSEVSLFYADSNNRAISPVSSLDGSSPLDKQREIQYLEARLRELKSASVNDSPVNENVSSWPSRPSSPTVATKQIFEPPFVFPTRSHPPTSHSHGRTHSSNGNHLGHSRTRSQSHSAHSTAVDPVLVQPQSQSQARYTARQHSRSHSSHRSPTNHHNHSHNGHSPTFSGRRGKAGSLSSISTTQHTSSHQSAGTSTPDNSRRVVLTEDFHLYSRPNVSLSSLFQQSQQSHSQSVTLRLSLRSIIEHNLLIEFCTDQFGSRYIQQLLESAPQSDVTLLFHHLVTNSNSNLLLLSCNTFANYIIQKLIEYGSSTQRQEIGSMLVNHYYKLAKHIYGCRVVQKIIEHSHANSGVLVSILKELELYGLVLAQDSNGNHCLQKMIENVPNNAMLSTLTHGVRDNIPSLCQHSYGCRVVQKLLEYSGENDRKIIINSVLGHLSALIVHSFGNYPVQSLIQYGSDNDRLVLYNHTKGSLLYYSQQKFASNCIEKCLFYFPFALKALVMEELLDYSSDSGRASVVDERHSLVQLIVHPYGNYVANTLLTIIQSQPSYHRYFAAFHATIPVLRRSQGGKHLLKRIEMIVDNQSRQH